MKGKYRKNEFGLYNLSKKQIEEEAQALLNEYNHDLFVNPQAVPIEEIIEMHLRINLEISQIDEFHKILGMAILSPGNIEVYKDGKKENFLIEKPTIIVDDCYADSIEGRYRFTLAHECGHHYLQGDLYAYSFNQISLFDDLEENRIASFRDVEFVIKKKANELQTKEDWQEWQANYFASAILMPKAAVKKLFFEYIRNNKFENIDFLLKNECIDKMKSVFNVSKEAAEYRFNELFI